MTTRITATLIGGLLKPDEALPWSDQTRVTVTVEPLEERRDLLAAWESLNERLAKRPIDATGQHFTRDELHERR